MHDRELPADLYYFTRFSRLSLINGFKHETNQIVRLLLGRDEGL